MQPLERDVETLRNIPLFATLPTARLKLIAYTAEVVHFEPNEVMVREGDPADAVYIITEGQAEVLLTSGSDKEILLGTMGRHTLFGETAVLAKTSRTATVRAKDRVVTFKISSKLFLDLLRESPEIGMQVLALLAQRLERNAALMQQWRRGQQ